MCQKSPRFSRATQGSPEVPQSTQNPKSCPANLKPKTLQLHNHRYCVPWKYSWFLRSHFPLEDSLIAVPKNFSSELAKMSKGYQPSWYWGSQHSLGVWSWASAGRAPGTWRHPHVSPHQLLQGAETSWDFGEIAGSHWGGCLWARLPWLTVCSSSILRSGGSTLPLTPALPCQWQTNPQLSIWEGRALPGKNI